MLNFVHLVDLEETTSNKSSSIELISPVISEPSRPLAQLDSIESNRNSAPHFLSQNFDLNLKIDSSVQKSDTKSVSPAESPLDNLGEANLLFETSPLQELSQPTSNPPSIPSRSVNPTPSAMPNMTETPVKPGFYTENYSKNR